MYVEKKLRKLLMDWWIVPLAFSSSKLLDIVFWLYILVIYVISAVQMTSCIVQNDFVIKHEAQTSNAYRKSPNP